jgi:cation diffusion facilitator family transporter
MLAAGKFLAGVIGHSSALVADAVESLADTVGSIVVWHGLRIADRPSDEDHPYGYGKAEAVAALCVGALLLVAAIVIVVKAFREILTPHDAPAAWTLIVLVGVIAVKEAMVRFVLHGAKNLLESDAARADAITSAAAFVGITIAIWGPGLFDSPRLVLADEAAAMIASGVILFTGLSLMRPALRELLDANAPDLADKVRATVLQVEGVRLVEKLHARKSGRGYHVDMHLHVAADMDVRAAHSLSGKVKAHVRERHPNVLGVLIHIEPDEPASTPSDAQQ